MFGTRTWKTQGYGEEDDALLFTRRVGVKRRVPLGNSLVSGFTQRRPLTTVVRAARVTASPPDVVRSPAAGEWPFSLSGTPPQSLISLGVSGSGTLPCAAPMTSALRTGWVLVRANDQTSPIRRRPEEPDVIRLSPVFGLCDGPWRAEGPLLAQLTDSDRGPAGPIVAKLVLRICRPPSHPSPPQLGSARHRCRTPRTIRYRPACAHGLSWLWSRPLLRRRL